MSTSTEATPHPGPGTTTTSGETGRTRGERKVRQGIAVSTAADKTAVVLVERRTTHPLYGKTVTRTEKLHAHDETNDVRTGDRVRIVETRPLSKKKRWRVTEIIERAK